MAKNFACSYYGQMFASSEGGEWWVKLPREFTEKLEAPWRGCPTNDFRFSIGGENTRAATQIGVTIAPNVLARADIVIK